MKIILHNNRRNRPDKYTIEYEVYFSRTDRVFIPTKVIIEPKYWDMRSQTVKLTHPDYISHNHKIKRLKERLNEIEERYASSGEILTGNILRLELTNTRQTTTLNEYIREQIEVDKPSVKPATYKKFISVLNNLNEFRQIPLTTCDTNIIREYHNHLLKSMKLTTTGKNHKVINKYLKRAVDDKLIKENPYKSFKIPKGARRKIYLTAEELNLIRTKVIPGEKLTLVKDMFLFMCNTGMEYIDMTELTSENITVISGRKFIIKNRIKVEREMQMIPLLPEAVSIIDKYDKGTGRIFPIRSNQKLNNYLKEIQDICQIEKNLTTIVARHTFATLMLTLGMPLESVSHILGHSNTSTTRIYAKMLVNKLDNDLNRLGIESI